MQEIGLADEINGIVGVDSRQKVTCGEAVVAMVLNALGFGDRTLYLFPEFMGTKPVEILIREGLKAEDSHLPSVSSSITNFWMGSYQIPTALNLLRKYSLHHFSIIL
ncbi:MAG: hypothetical protein C4B56_04915 [Candidatus Methanophagaceae archaeon]|nr:MAG: hypothetical protein C4B56_04915 [Methanophagales archaeon]